VYAAGDAAFHGAAEPADADEYVKIYSRTSLERVLKEVAAMGGLDKFVDSENEDEDGDVNVTAEDMEQIINLVKMKRRERAGTMERGRKKTGGGAGGQDGREHDRKRREQRRGLGGHLRRRGGRAGVVGAQGETREVRRGGGQKHRTATRGFGG
jgi:hypothetical protein